MHRGSKVIQQNVRMQYIKFGKLLEALTYYTVSQRNKKEKRGENTSSQSIQTPKFLFQTLILTPYLAFQ